jgi:CheY-like chemotaxis protein
VKILVVDDHVLIREALRGILKELKGDVTVLEAATCGQAMQLIADHTDLKLILLDLNLRSKLDDLARRGRPVCCLPAWRMAPRAPRVHARAATNRCCRAPC